MVDRERGEGPDSSQIFGPAHGRCRTGHRVDGQHPDRPHVSPSQRTREDLQVRGVATKGVGVKLPTLTRPVWGHETLVRWVQVWVDFPTPQSTERLGQ